MPSTPDTIRLREPADAIGIVPYLLGFHPTTSMVVLALQHTRILTVARFDLPTGVQDRNRCGSVAELLAARLPGIVDQAVLIGYGPHEAVTAAVDITATALTGARIRVRDALRVTDGRWWNLTCTNPRCCPPHGTAFEATTSVAAAAATVAGLVALPNRNAVAEQLAPISGPARKAFATATASAVTRLLQLTKKAVPINGAGSGDEWMDTPPGRAVVVAGKESVSDALSTYRNGRVLDDHRAATLTVLLGIPAVRDTAILLSSGDDWQVRMWTDLLRRAEPEFSPAPAILLAVVALQAGNGVLAQCAVNRALHADPGSRMAQLVLQLVQAGIDPHSMAALIADVS